MMQGRVEAVAQKIGEAMYSNAGGTDGGGAGDDD